MACSRRAIVSVFSNFRRRPRDTSEAAFFWKYIQEKQLSDLIERLPQLLLPSAFDQPGLQGAIVKQRPKVQAEVRSLRVDFRDALGELMAARGRVTEGVFNRFVVLISAQRTTCQSSSPSPQLECHGSSNRLCFYDQKPRLRLGSSSGQHRTPWEHRRET